MPSQFSLNSWKTRCMILRCAYFIVPRELFVSLCLWKYWRSKLALAGIFHAVVQEANGVSAENETKRMPLQFSRYRKEKLIFRFGFVFRVCIRGNFELWSVKACPATLDRWFWVLALPLVVGPPNLQNQLTLTSEGALNYYGSIEARKRPLWEGRGSKSTTRESQFAIEIRPLAVVITFESGAQYTAFYETHMN